MLREVRSSNLGQDFSQIKFPGQILPLPVVIQLPSFSFPKCKPLALPANPILSKYLCHNYLKLRVESFQQRLDIFAAINAVLQLNEVESWNTTLHNVEYQLCCLELATAASSSVQFCSVSGGHSN